ncbi:MAG: GntR family transcriptional regulator [Rudaea sp.]
MTHAPDSAAKDESPGRGEGLRSSRRARYLQIADLLREEIRRGDHAVGQRFPAEAALCKRFAVSRHTARAAMRLLEDQGLVARRRGSGTTVRSADTQISYDQHIRSINDLLQYTNATGFQFLYTDRILADSILAGWLNVRVGAECIHFHGIRYQRRTQLPYCLGEVYRRASWQGLPNGYTRMEDAMHHLIEEQFQQSIGKVEQSLSAVTMTPEQAEELKVRPDTPGFRSVRRYFNIKGRLVLVAITLHPGPMFNYFTRYERSELGD